ncbi:nitroreductase [Streptomyces jumonjinensis]|uniref:nitroreductase n=1 Tax=Streptomyces jumonjinensis TaxID=1945 RepID=UPI0037AE616F
MPSSSAHLVQEALARARSAAPVEPGPAVRSTPRRPGEPLAVPPPLDRVLRLSLAGGRLRPVASAGALHPVETRLLVGPGCGIPPGRYGYDPGRHRLFREGDPPGPVPDGAFAALGARVGPTVAHYGHRAWPLVLLDVGHAAAAVTLARVAGTESFLGVEPFPGVDCLSGVGSFPGADWHPGVGSLPGTGSPLPARPGDRPSSTGRTGQVPPADACVRGVRPGPDAPAAGCSRAEEPRAAGATPPGGRGEPVDPAGSPPGALALVRLTGRGEAGPWLAGLAHPAGPLPAAASGALADDGAPATPATSATSATPGILADARRVLGELARSGPPITAWATPRGPAPPPSLLLRRRSAHPAELGSFRAPPDRAALARVLAEAHAACPEGPRWCLALGGDRPGLAEAGPDGALRTLATGDVLPTLAVWAARQGWIAGAGAVLLAYGCPHDATPRRVLRDHLRAGYGIGHAQLAAAALGLASRPIGSWQRADLGAALGGKPGRDWILHGLALATTEAADRTTTEAAHRATTEEDTS